MIGSRIIKNVFLNLLNAKLNVINIIPTAKLNSLNKLYKLKQNGNITKISPINKNTSALFFIISPFLY